MSGCRGRIFEPCLRKAVPLSRYNVFDSFDGVFSAVQNGLCRYGILPIENSTAGSVNKVYDLMSKNKFYIVRSIRLKVDHSLLAKKERHSPM